MLNASVACELHVRVVYGLKKRINFADNLIDKLFSPYLSGILNARLSYAAFIQLLTKTRE